MKAQQQHQLAEVLSIPQSARSALNYLEHDLPGYPFNSEIDRPFVEELHNDFPTIDLLEQIKLFRWYHDNGPPLDQRPRVTLRRWIARARTWRKR